VTDQTGSSFLKILGPGLLFAGAAIGVSHLVQSTRAGAVYGLSMIAFVIIANLVKYPAFLIGNQYAAASGENLIDAYRRQGIVAVWFFLLATVATMFAACAAISITTAALAKATFGLPFDTFTVVLGVWAIVAGILLFGQYRALDLIIKILLATLTVATLAATALVLPKVAITGVGEFWLTEFSMPTIIFIAALVGWMPAPLDTSVWQSLWSQAKANADGRSPTMDEAATDYNVGFIGTMFLAICFVLMGAGVMHGSGLHFEASAVGFAQQIIYLYRSTLGNTAAQLVGVSAMAVIFSTTLTALDAWPRTLYGVYLSLRGESGVHSQAIARASRHPFYWLSMGGILLGATLVLQVLQNSFALLIDIATTVSFLTAPIFAFLNHRAMFAHHIPPANRPGGGLRLWSVIGVILLTGFALGYLWIRVAA